MSLLTRLVPNFLRSSAVGVGSPCTTLIPEVKAVPETLFGQMIRTIMRCHFPRPSERKRIKRHGFKARMSTPGGRRILMRRILKGKFVLSH